MFSYLIGLSLVVALASAGDGNAYDADADYYPESTDFRGFETSEAAECNQTEPWWSDDFCGLCKCRCISGSDHGGAVDRKCYTQCYEFSDTSDRNNYAIYYAAEELCDYDCTFGWRELSIDISNDTCSCDSITSVCYYNNCTAGDITFEEESLTNAGGDTVTKCKACVCLDYDDYISDTSTTDSDDSMDNFEKCGIVESRDFWDYLSRGCSLDCEWDDAIFDDTDCGCPKCPDGTSTTGNPDVRSTMGSEEKTTESRDAAITTTEDDSIFETAVNTRTYNNSQYLYIELGVQMTRYWDDREEYQQILAKALRRIFEGSDLEYNEDETKIIFAKFRAYKVEDEETTTSVPDVDTGSGTDRRLLARDSVEITIQIDFAMAVFFLAGSDAEDWFDYLVDLGSSFSIDYITNCDSEARELDDHGWGDITITNALVALYDEDRNLITSETYDTDPDPTTDDSGDSSTDPSASSSSDAFTVGISSAMLFLTSLIVAFRI